MKDMQFKKELGNAQRNNVYADFTAINPTLNKYEEWAKGIDFAQLEVMGVDILFLHVGITGSKYIELCEMATGNPMQLKLLEYGEYIFLLIKFGENEWIDVPFTIHLSENQPPSMPEEDEGYKLMVRVYNADDGRVYLDRRIGLSNEISRTFADMVSRQAEKPFDKKCYDNGLAEIYRRYKVKDMVNMAKEPGFRLDGSVVCLVGLHNK